jgi:lipopolysaccharide biosynthesis protein
LLRSNLPTDDLNFIKSLIPFFKDSRYIRLDGKPFLIVYRPQHLPDARKTITLWRDYCRSIGIGEIYLAAALSHGNTDYAQHGFDAGVEFPPHNLRSANKNEEVDFHAPFSGNAMQYSEIAQSYIDRQYDAHCSNVFRAVFPSWDNTARTGSKALVTLNGTPENYEYWLAETVRRTQNDYPGQERFVFINAWNEWAEGCHLEPDRVYGHAFLEATLRTKQGKSIANGFAHQLMPTRKAVADEAIAVARTLQNDLRQVLEYHGPMKVNKLKTEASRRPWLKLLLLPVWRLLRRIFNLVRSKA